MNSTIEIPSALAPYRKQLISTVKPCAKMQTQVCRDASPWQSKFLGRPYFLKADDFPRTSQGEYLYLLAQINFAEVPLLEGFPQKGILQFYLSNTEMYGLDLENPAHQNRFRVIYHADLEMDESKLVDDFSFMTSPWIEDDIWMPFTVMSKYLDKPDRCLALTFRRENMPMSPQDYRYEETVGCDVFKLGDGEYDAEMEAYDKFFIGHHLGGYPAFAQADPRSRLPKEEEPYVLLLQIDSDYNNAIEIVWGDSGVCNFFIKQSALKRLDFSDVLYNWDCC